MRSLIFCLCLFIASPALAESSASELPDAPLQVFVTSWCPYCKALVDDLRRRGVAFERYDIEKNPAANKKYLELGNGGVPMSVIRGKIVIRGYRPDDIIAALKR